MMKSFVVVIALMAIASASAMSVVRDSEPMKEAALPSCATSSTAINVSTGQYGCTLGSNFQTMTYTFSSDISRNYKLAFNGYTDAALSVYVGDELLFKYTSQISVPLTFPSGKVVRITYGTGSYIYSGYYVTIDITLAPTPYPLVSGQTYNLQKEQQGGFVYFALPWYGKGQLFALDVSVYSYQGLKEPTAYVSVNSMPTLEKYDLTNVTVHTGADREQAVIYKPNPVDGYYFVGVFLYGSTARISVNAQWTFNINRLTSGVRVQAKTAAIDYYQLNVPVNTKQLKFQISREVPGGNPIAYIAAGSLASAKNYQWIADTNTQSYISIVINDPNPINSTSPNPGNYVFAIAATSASGYIIQCDW